jgi:holo-[acyl-carrier protein] synthase
MDLVDVVDVEESLARFGDDYARRLYTDRELGACRADARRLAACFAAKEATLKALDAGDAAIDWRSVEILTDGGDTTARLHGPSADLAAAHGVARLTISTSIARTYASAVAIAETTREGEG